MEKQIVFDNDDYKLIFSGKDREGKLFGDTVYVSRRYEGWHQGGMAMTLKGADENSFLDGEFSKGVDVIN